MPAWAASAAAAAAMALLEPYSSTFDPTMGSSQAVPAQEEQDSGSEGEMEVQDEVFRLLVGQGGPPPFFCAGQLPSEVDPGLAVAGVGSVHLPLDAAGAAALRPPAGPMRMAPFGHGEETRTDESVRRTWQLDPSMFSLEPGELYRVRCSLLWAGDMGTPCIAVHVPC